MKLWNALLEILFGTYFRSSVVMGIITLFWSVNGSLIATFAVGLLFLADVFSHLRGEKTPMEKWRERKLAS